MKLSISSLYLSMLHIIPILLRKKSNYKKHYKLIFFIMIFRCLGVTMGMHRLWTHKSFNTTKIIKIILLFICNSTGEQSVIDWSSNHRMHHRYEETDISLDPYSIKKGFLWAHMFSFFFKKSKKYKDVQNKVKTELKNERSNFDNKILNFEDKNYVILLIITGIIIPTLSFQKYYKNGLITSFNSAILCKLITYHCTWSVNSFAHLVGEKPYNKEHTSVDNHLVSLFTSGEGYHNYHHTFPKDYKASKNLRCLNLTGLVIFLLSKVNLTWDLIESKV